MSKRRYKEYLGDDTAVISRTSRWRSEQCCESEVDFEANSNSTLATEYQSRLNSDDQEEPTTNYAETLDINDFVCNECLSDQDVGNSQTWNDVSTDDSDSFKAGSYTFDEQSDISDELSGVSDGWSDHSDDLPRVFNEDPHYGFVNGGNQLIYEGAELTHNQSLVLLMSFVLKHKLTDQALGDFLTIINMHLPNVVLETKYLFYKKFNHQAFVHHYFCKECFFFFGPSTNCDKDKVCSCDQPKVLESAKRSKSYFSYWSVQSQLELMLQDDSIAQSLLNPSEKHCNDSFITDATDGQLFTKLKKDHGYGQKDISLL